MMNDSEQTPTNFPDQKAISSRRSADVGQDYPGLRSIGEQRQLVELAEDLRAITTTTDDYSELIRHYLQAASIRGKFLAVAWYEQSHDGDSNCVDSCFKNGAMNNQATREMLEQASRQAFEKNRQQIVRSENLRGTLAVSVPAYKNEQSSIVVTILFHDDKSRCTEALSFCQNIASHFEIWRSREQMTALSKEVRTTATVLELVGRAENCQSVKQAAITVTNELQTLFRCDYVVIGTKNPSQQQCQLSAISSLGEYDSQSRTSRIMLAAFDEVVLHRDIKRFPTSRGEKSTASLMHKKLAEQLRCEAAISTPIRDQDNEIVGAITILGNRDLILNDATVNFLRAVEHPIGNAFQVVSRVQGGWFTRLGRFLSSNQNRRAKWTSVVLFVLMLGAMFLPVAYRIPTDCTAEPVIRRFAVAPQDGLLENTLVEPGEVVTAGQVLAKMDGREMGLRISEVIAKTSKAAQEYSMYLASKETSKAIQADLQRKALNAELKLLENRQANLDVRSAIAGVILSGSIDKRTNFPVSMGQKLYEIAPLSPLRVELAIPAQEVMHVREGQSVSFRFDGFGSDTFEGKIEAVRPNSVIRNDENVFIAIAQIPNRDTLIRPGMRGQARIVCDQRTLGWTLFHHPWEKLIYAVGL